MSQAPARYTTDQIDSLVYSRSEALTAAIEYIRNAREMIEKGYGLHFPIPEIANEYPVPPILPGKSVTIQAQSSHGKSQFLSFWKDDLARRLDENPNPKNIAISISTEDMIEEEMAVMLLKEANKGNTGVAMDKIDGLLVVSTKIGSTPFYYIGKSIERAHTELPPLNMTNIGKAIFRIIERRKDKGMDTTVQGVFYDYINATEEDKDLMSAVVDKKRNLQVRSDFFYLRDNLLPRIPAPAVVAVQSKQKLDNTKGANMLTPGLYDMQETSAIPQHTDFDFSLWMPKRTHPYGEIIEHGKTKLVRFAVSDELAIIQCNKQRGYDLQTLKRLPSDKYWFTRIDYNTGKYSTWTPEGTLDNLYKKESTK
jgi:hypothetical protein